MCTVFYNTLCKVMCSLYLWLIEIGMEGLKSDSVHVRCSNIVFATYAHTLEPNVIILLLLQTVCKYYIINPRNEWK